MLLKPHKILFSIRIFENYVEFDLQKNLITDLNNFKNVQTKGRHSIKIFGVLREIKLLIRTG